MYQFLLMSNPYSKHNYPQKPHRSRPQNKVLVNPNFKSSASTYSSVQSSVSTPSTSAYIPTTTSNSSYGPDGSFPSTSIVHINPKVHSTPIYFAFLSYTNCFSSFRSPAPCLIQTTPISRTAAVLPTPSSRARCTSTPTLPIDPFPPSLPQNLSGTPLPEPNLSLPRHPQLSRGFHRRNQSMPD